ncbi:MAG: ShlB/FhaC/HecB family hemolysin secretion/activation protein [Mitsuaria chitosanitabida]|uniref:ShlB/FhaC/HecB family hemolysin secretion/activation protein n=1 Tax=Roseateles chitosanitabidus TaxID=65048 RepID=UPI001B06A0C0|nr:ShlB/FhaC/HecB family hemolysin secretion/activation protein [Roseateles chitosanitabidus]MBO9685306.1 ShlB/FhaC/HecB family hemolysin secretion/activation protein [Roseateles chitosanitabidus]
MFGSIGVPRRVVCATCAAAGVLGASLAQAQAAPAAQGVPAASEAPAKADVAPARQGAPTTSEAPTQTDATPTQAPADTAPAVDDTRTVDVYEYLVRGNTVLDARAIERAVLPYLGPARSRKDIDGAREALAAAYQAAGYQSIYVDLPEQQVTDGVVILQVSEVRVGRLRVTGSEYSSLTELRDQVPSLREGEVPNFQQAQTELNALNRGGQRQVMPLVRQGAMPGTMDVDLKVDDRSPWRVSAGLNNDKSADTRALRASLSVGHDNLWQAGHSASLSLFATPQDYRQTNVLSGSYTAPIKGSHWAVEASGYVSDSQIATLGGTTVLGKGHAAGLKATYTVPDAGVWWHALSLGLDVKRNREAVRVGVTADNVPLDYVPLTLSYSGVRSGEDSQLALGVSAVVGTRGLLGYGSDWRQFDYKRYKASPGFLVLKGDLNGSLNLWRGAQIATRLAVQASDSALVSAEQMAAGGMNSVRGYLSAERVGDVGVVGSFELRSPALSLSAIALENARLYAFFDFGHLRLRDPLPEQQSRFTLYSRGLGASFALGPGLSGRLDYGYPLRAGERTRLHDARLTFNLNASY